MISKLREAREKEEGFTLIELLVVVIIIGILAAIAIPAFLNQRQRAWQAEVTSDIRNAALDVEAEATANNGEYPDLASTINNFNPGDQTTLSGYTRDANATRFCMVATHDNLTGNVVAYDSGQNGLLPFNEAGYTCTAGVAAVASSTSTTTQ